MHLKFLILLPLILVLASHETESINLECLFYNNEYGFTCAVQGAKLLSGLINSNNNNNDEIKFTGRNREKREVKYLLFTDSEMSYVPAEVFSTFPKIEILGFDNCLLDYISNKNFFKFANNLRKLLIVNSHIYNLKSDTFKQLPNLEEIVLNYNDIRILDSRSFQHNKKLMGISITDNKINAIEPTTFGHLNQLEFVDLRDNECIDNYISNPQNEAVMTQTMERCVKNYKTMVENSNTMKKPESVEKPPNANKFKDKVSTITTTTKVPATADKPQRDVTTTTTTTTENPIDEKCTPEREVLKQETNDCNCNELKAELKEMRSMLSNCISCLTHFTGNLKHVENCNAQCSQCSETTTNYQSDQSGNEDHLLDVRDGSVSENHHSDKLFFSP